MVVAQAAGAWKFLPMSLIPRVIVPGDPSGWSMHLPDMMAVISRRNLRILILSYYIKKKGACLGVRQTSEVMSRPSASLRQPPGISELNPGLSWRPFSEVTIAGAVFHVPGVFVSTNKIV